MYLLCVCVLYKSFLIIKLLPSATNDELGAVVGEVTFTTLTRFDVELIGIVVVLLLLLLEKELEILLVVGTEVVVEVEVFVVEDVVVGLPFCVLFDFLITIK